MTRSWNTWRALLILTMVAVGGACEGEGNDPIEPIQAPTVMEAQYEVPAEWEGNTQAAFVSYWGKAGFTGSQAYGQGYTKWVATHGRTGVVANVYNSFGLLGSDNGAAADGNLYPWTWSHYANAGVSVPKTCGHRVDVSTSHRIWNQIPGGEGILSEKVRGDVDFATQPDCSSECATQIIVDPWDECTPDEGESGGGNDGGGTDGLSCQTVIAQLVVNGEVIYDGPIQVCE